MSSIVGSSSTPKDPFKLVYIIFYWLGIGTLLPWNFFLAGKKLQFFNTWTNFVLVERAGNKPEYFRFSLPVAKHARIKFFLILLCHHVNYLHN
jgi:hypothetical protein